MNLDALRSLQEQASPGDWVVVESGDSDHDNYIEKWLAIVPADEVPKNEEDDIEEIARVGVTVMRHGQRFRDRLEEEDAANAKLMVVSKNHLLPISEALEVGQCWSWGDDDCAEHSPDDLCGRCKALKALQEALE